MNKIVNLNNNYNVVKDVNNINNNKNNFLNNKRNNDINIKDVNNNPVKDANNYNKLKEIDDINMHIFNLKDDNLNYIDFDDRMNVDERFNTRKHDYIM